MTDEIWRKVPIRAAEDRYEVSSLGRIRSAKKILRPYIAKWDGRKMRGKRRLLVALCPPKGKKIRASVARLVALAFCKNSRPGIAIQVNHIDGDPANNRAENLEWVTPMENIAHAHKLGLFVKGADHPTRKLVPERVERLLAAGKTRAQIAKIFGCTKEAVSAHTLRFGLRKKQKGRAERRDEMVAKLTRNNHPKGTRNPAHATVCRMYISGHTLEKIAERVGISRSRAGQIIRMLANR